MFPAISANVRMPGSLLAAACGSLAAIAATVFSPAPGRDGAALQPVFNGRDLSGWRAPADPHWRVVDGVLVGASGRERLGATLLTERDYGDVVVEAEIRSDDVIDAGVVVRWPDLQVQLGYSRDLDRDMTGSIFTGEFPVAGRAREAAGLWKTGEWNRVRIESRGDTCTVGLNGVEVARLATPRAGGRSPIGLQLHPGRDMRVECRGFHARPL